VRQDLHRAERRLGEHEAGYTRLPDSAELGQRYGRVLRTQLLMIRRGVQRATAPSAVVALALAAPAIGQPTGRIPTVTRLVKIFSELETRIVDSAHAGDASALDAMLDAAFELRVGDAPGT